MASVRLMFRIGFWVSIILIVCTTLTALAFPFISEADTEPLDLGKTKLWVAVVYVSLQHMRAYVWICLGLTIVAAYSFFANARGNQGTKSMWSYIIAKGMVSAWVTIVVGSILLAGGPAVTAELFYSGGEVSTLHLHNVPLLVFVLVDLVMSVPWFLMIIARVTARRGRQD